MERAYDKRLNGFVDIRNEVIEPLRTHVHPADAACVLANELPGLSRRLNGHLEFTIVSAPVVMRHVLIYAMFGRIRASYNAPALLLCLLIATGCDDSAMREAGSPEADTAFASHPTDSTDTGRAPMSGGAAIGDSVFAQLQTVHFDAVKEAFQALEGAAFTRRIRTEQLDRAGDRIAYRERVMAVDSDTTSVLSRDSSGSFDYGFLRRFTSDEAARDEPWELAAYILADDPAYLSPRSREAYEYRSGSGALSGVGPVTVIDVRAHPEFGTDQAIRRARIYLDPGTNRVVAQEIERSDQALWFRESSDLFIGIRRDSAVGWVPNRTRIETRVRMPFRPIQRFRTESTFSNVLPHQAGERVVARDLSEN